MAGFSAATTTAKGFEATNKNKKGKSGKPQVAASLRTLAVALQSYGKEKGPGAQRGWEMGRGQLWAWGQEAQEAQETPELGAWNGLDIMFG